jgi:hypothetical protein
MFGNLLLLLCFGCRVQTFAESNWLGNSDSGAGYGRRSDIDVEWAKIKSDFGSWARGERGGDKQREKKMINGKTIKKGSKDREI